MDYYEFDMDFVSAVHLKISENRWIRLREMFIKEGFVDGVASGNIILSVSNLKITL